MIQKDTEAQKTEEAQDTRERGIQNERRSQKERRPDRKAGQRRPRAWKLFSVLIFCYFFIKKKVMGLCGQEQTR
jgi:hypothetical protein